MFKEAKFKRRSLTEMGITFSYDIGITNFLARWKACCEGCVILYLKGVNKKFFTGLKVRYDDLGFLVGEFDDG